VLDSSGWISSLQCQMYLSILKYIAVYELSLHPPRSAGVKPNLTSEDMESFANISGKIGQNQSVFAGNQLSIYEGPS